MATVAHAGDPPQDDRRQPEAGGRRHSHRCGKYKPATNEISGRKMLVSMPHPESMGPDVQPPLVKVFYHDQLEHRLLRKALLKRQPSRQIMEPYYGKAEGSSEKARGGRKRQVDRRRPLRTNEKLDERSKQRCPTV